jgi:four helix bundle protein
VFQRAYALSLAVHRASLAFPRVEQFGLAEQVRRASKSICANLAEGFGKQRDSSAEFKRFLLMAIGSSEEMQVRSRYCKDLGYIDDQAFVAWYGGYKVSGSTSKLEIARSSSGFWLPVSGFCCSPTASG